jgi:hypothetical protein
MNDFPLKYSEANQPGRFRPVPTEFKFKLTNLMKRKGKRCGCRWPAGVSTAFSLSRMVHFSSLNLFPNIQPANQESKWGDGRECGFGGGCIGKQVAHSESGLRRGRSFFERAGQFEGAMQIEKNEFTWNE